MLKSLTVAITMLVSTGVVAQQFSISGTVRDEKNQALAGASVQVENSSRATATDEFGKFRLEKLSPGEYSLRIRFLGYEDRVEKLQVSQNAEVEIALTESVQLTDEVIVYATRANEKTPTTFTNVSGRALQKQN